MPVPRSYFTWVCLGWLLLSPLEITQGASDPEKSVVHITTFAQQPVWNAPWRRDPVQKWTGSGFVIQGKRIMTNAHVVSWGREIIVKRYQDPRAFPAHVLYVAHDCDLAVLEVDDPSFFAGMDPLPFGPLPKVRTTVTTYGYPAGGDQISYTRGVVSRIEMQPYSHIGNRSFLTVQTDAAINPGNSGGPVLQNQHVVGVAFQGYSGAGLENVGFFIPTPVIDHFLKDISDGHYAGFPDAGIMLDPLENPSYRRYLKLPTNGLGARISHLLPMESTRKLLREDDVLLQVRSHPVASDATILLEGNRVNAGAAFDQAQDGESVPLKIWRDGHAMDISIPMHVFRDDIAQGNQYDRPPRYFVYGGLIFTPLSLNYLYTFGRDWSKLSGPELRYMLFCHNDEHPDERRSEPVVLAGILPHPINADMGVKARKIVDKINGIRINSMDDVSRAFESGKGKYHSIEFYPHKEMECMDREEASKANPAILKTYKLPRDRS